jgi:hypothetical protein
MLTLEFEPDRETKNAIRFAEVTDRDRGIVGTVYVLKDELQQLGWKEGDTLTVTFSVTGASKPAARKAAASTKNVVSSGRTRRTSGNGGRK